jgi:hypothetical protein
VNSVRKTKETVTVKLKNRVGDGELCQQELKNGVINERN